MTAENVEMMAFTCTIDLRLLCRVVTDCRWDVEVFLSEWIQERSEWIDPVAHRMQHTLSAYVMNLEPDSPIGLLLLQQQQHPFITPNDHTSQTPTHRSPRAHSLTHTPVCVCLYVFACVCSCVVVDVCLRVFLYLPRMY